jgi:hypothetical protein
VIKRSNPTNLNIKGTTTNDFMDMQFTLIPDQKSKKTYQFSKKHKISTIKRQQFYTHHRKSLRKLAFIL